MTIGWAASCDGFPVRLCGALGRTALSRQAVDVIANLKRDFGLKMHQAAGILGNLAHESHAFQWLHQLAKGGKEWLSPKAGLGWAQWSGKRGQNFLKYAFDKGQDWRSPEANYGYLASELRGQYKHVLDLVRHARTLASATSIFERGYEGAGKPNMPSRYAFARHINLLDSARQAGMMGHQHTVTGDATISVDFRGMPRGVIPKASASGIFKEVKLNRGRAGAFANQEG